MSEALTVVRVSRDNIPIPRGCTPRQVKLARLVVERDPNSDQSLRAMLKEAGYADTSAENSTRLILSSSGVTRAIAAIQAEQPDSAREIARKAAKSVSNRLDTMQDGPLIMAWKTAAEIQQASPPEEADKARIPRSWYRIQLRRWLLAMYRRGAKASAKQCTCEHNPPRCLPRLAQLTDH